LTVGRIQYEVEMGAEQPILLKPRCPAPDDPEILEFLCLAGAVCSMQWIELTIETEASGVSQSYLAGVKNGDGNSVALEVGDGYSASVRCGAENPPSPEAIEVLSTNLMRTFERRYLRAQTTVLRGALDGTTSSILLFDERGNIVFANQPADRLLSLQTEDELLAECGGAPRQPLFTLLATLIERVASSSGGSKGFSDILNLADGRIMKCEITPIQAARDGEPGVVLVFLQPVGTESEVRYDSFSSSHGLSPREHEVVLLLVQGLATTAMADQLGISPHTVRDHLKHLYRKTETRSRSELLGLISRSRRSTDVVKKPR
jgi:DNA-binding CsgD family transcriptional regulator/PAS domain-containing protein